MDQLHLKNYFEQQLMSEYVEVLRLIISKTYSFINMMKILILRSHTVMTECIMHTKDYLIYDSILQ